MCEILSPPNRRHDRLTKANIYLRIGVAFYWVVDPEVRTVEARERVVDASGRASWRIAGTWSDGDVVEVPPFEAVRLDVGRLFPPERAAETPAGP